MSYMGIQPVMLCASETYPEQFTECNTAAACLSTLPTKVDTTQSIVNWLVSFNLYCEPTSSLRLLQYLFFVGFFLGSILIAPLSDYFGRKPIILLSCIILSLAYLKLVFTEELVTWTAVLVGSGICVGLYYTVSITYLSEIATQRSAAVYICAFHLAFPISGVIVALILMYSLDWKTPATLMAIVPLVIISYFAYLVESPRNLAAKNSFEDARVAANRISTCNLGKIRRWNFENEYVIYTRAYTEFETHRQTKWYQTQYLLSNSSGRYYLVAFSILLFCTGFAFSGLALSQPSLFKNVMVNSIVCRGIEFAMIIVSGLLFYFFGHIRPIFILLILTSLLGIACTFSLWLGVLSYLTKLCVLSAGLGVIAFATSSCPARVRASGVGFTLGLGLIGIVLGSVVKENYSSLHFLFPVASLLGIVGLRFTCEPEDYRTNDDIYEIVEDAKKNFSAYKPQPEDDSIKHYLESPLKGKGEEFSIKDLLKDSDKEDDNKQETSYKMEKLGKYKGGSEGFVTPDKKRAMKSP